MYSTSVLALLLSSIYLTSAHIIITYPGWRGNNLISNGTLPEMNPNTIGIDTDANGTTAFPYGMQWMYPCGGMPLSQNRTKWPVHGGAVSFIPEANAGHQTASIYINIGITEPGQLNPPNMSHPVVSGFSLVGVNNSMYYGQFCIPQVGMPPNLNLPIGTNITLQIVELAVHGAALYSCVDLTLADPSEVEPVTKDNCHNDSLITYNQIFTTANLTSSATPALFGPPTLISLLSTTVFISILAGTFFI